MRGTLAAGRRRQAGQSAVEFALSSFVLLFLALGLLDFARGFYFAVRLQDAARAGARVGVAYNAQTGQYPYLDDSDIKTATDAVLTATGLPASTLSNGSGTTCPPTRDGNSLYNPPYQDTAFPSSTGHALLFICYQDQNGLEPPLASPRGTDLNVVLLLKYGLISGFLANQLGPGIEMYGTYHALIP